MTDEMQKDYDKATIGFFLKQIPKRLVELVVKLISFRTAVLVPTFYLVSKGMLGDYAWVLVALMAVFGRDALKVVGQLKK
jgi:hypothetical protein